MIVLTDDVAYAESLIAPQRDWSPARFYGFDPGLRELAARLFASRPVFVNASDADNRWSHAFVVKEAPCSQYDLLIDLCRTNFIIPDGIVCLAGTGRNFHGQRMRPWVALEGNIHLTVFLAPRREINRYGVGFQILAAAALVETVDSLEGIERRAWIKWVNDILIGGAKVAGFLVHTLSRDRTVEAAVVGIGLNVSRRPELPEDPFVPHAASLQDFHREPSSLSPQKILSLLLDRLSENYELLLSGGIDRLLSLYRKRSLVVGRRVRIFTDPEEGESREAVSGRVVAIGDNLELWLECREKPVTKGRLILGK